MSARRTRSTQSMIRQAAELSVAVPQVVAHRLTRMAMAGADPSARDQREFERMGREKTAAFVESWNAMALQAFRANQVMAASLFRSYWSPSARGRPSASALAARMQAAALGVMAQGLTPVHRKATANARRLARTKLKLR